MATNQQEPEWLTSLLEQQQDEESPHVTKDPQEQMGQVDIFESLEPQTVQTDVMEDLREQAIRADDEFETEEKTRSAQFFLNMKPWQRLVLAILLFLDVALCGCMALAMSGQLVSPF